MPLPIRLADRLDSPSVGKDLPYLLPDGKAQVGIEYRKGERNSIHSITLVASQSESIAIEMERMRDDLIQHVVEQVLKKEKLKLDDRTRILVNPEGPLIGGGPAAHSGLTGRKTGMDTYGEYARHSGAALSGKEPLRIDRVGAYVARYAAKNVVAAGLAKECEVQLSYAIGAGAPVSLRVRTFGSSELDDEIITSRLKEAIDFRLGGIVRHFQLRKLPAVSNDGFYRKLAVYGQMGRVDLDAPRERTDKVDVLT